MRQHTHIIKPAHLSRDGIENRRSIKGFTLVELMITLVIAAILLTVGIPSFQTMMLDNKVIAQANRLIASLNMARSEAINRAESVTLTAASGNNWHTGWTVATAGGTTLRSEAALEGGTTLVGTANSLTYSSSGFLTGAAITFDLCKTGATTERRITVVAGGRVNMDADYVCP